MQTRRISYIELIRELNSGGTSKVYLGVNTLTGYLVAVKELDAQLFKNLEIRSLFINEANRYLDLEHPNIVKLDNLLLLPNHDTGYLVMEYIEGKNLKEYINGVTGPLPFSNAAMILSEALNAIDFAHEQDIIHNDIKPSNIMLTDSDPTEIKVIDFGISIDKNEQQVLSNMYTPYYASPEQTFHGHPVDKRTDIYSMGITLYELVVGHPPFTGKNLSRTELIEKVRTQKVPEVKNTEPFNEPYLDIMNKIIQKATHKDPDFRYQSCREFKDELELLF
jgi:serine/threonine protein kinase